MSPALKKLYECSSCGESFPQWQGRCPSCQAWNSLQESMPMTTKSRLNINSQAAATPPVPLSELKVTEQLRFSSGFSEFDRVLGGGLVSGSVILIGGNPGAGKSTLLLQSMAVLAKTKRVCYVSGEESANQILLHSQRLALGQQKIMLLTENNLEQIFASISQLKPEVLVVDSIQTIYSAQHTATMGGVGQVKECATQLTEYAKKNNCVLLLVGHVTKEGTLAGPRVLEHIVDASLVLESTADAKYRTLRAHKNRFGAVNEIGVLAMTDSGLRQVNNPSAIFMSHNPEAALGSSIAIVHEGSRQLLVEMQALVEDYTTNNPRRVSVGFDANRMALLLAVLSCHCNLSLTSNNVFLNIVGGLKVEDTGTDLPCILALVSIATKRLLPPAFASFGEVGLTGEIRAAPYGHERVKAAIRQGMEKIMIPKANDPKGTLKHKQVIPVGNIGEALAIAFPAQAGAKPAVKAAAAK